MSENVVDDAVAAVQAALERIATLQAERFLILTALRDLHAAVTEKLLDIDHPDDESWLHAFEQLMAALGQAQRVLQQTDRI